MIFIYFIYFFSGVIKTFLIHFNISLPVDFTLVASFLLIFAIFYDVFRNGIKTKINKHFFYSLSFLLIFYLWMIISLIYTPSKEYSYIKTLYFITNILAFIYPFMVKNFDSHKFLKYLAIILPFVSLYFISIFQSISSSVLLDEKALEVIGLYLSLATLLGIVALILLTSESPVLKNKITDYIVAAFSFVLILLMGARGPLFFVILIYFLFLSRNIFKQKIVIKKKLLYAILASIFIIIVGSFVLLSVYKEKITPLLERSTKRVELLFQKKSNTTQNVSVETRVEQLNFSLKKVTESFDRFVRGFGIGSFNLIYTSVDGRGYPHNILLETCFELGILGLALFLSFLITIVGKKQTNHFINHFIILFIILNMLKSSSLVDIRNYFTFFALFLLKINQSEKN